MYKITQESASLLEIAEYAISEIKQDTFNDICADPFAENRIRALIKLLAHFRAKEAVYEKVARYMLEKAQGNRMGSYMYVGNLMWVAPHVSTATKKEILDCFILIGDPPDVKALAHNCLSRHPTEQELTALRASISRQPFSECRFEKLLALAHLCASEEFVEETTRLFADAKHNYENTVDL